MTAAYRLKGLGWFGGCVVVTLGFYLVSLQVAAERKKLDLVNSRIVVAQREIRALDTEFDTRSNLIQLERWNGDTLALVAPTAQQFVKNEAQLASIRFDRAMPGTAPGAAPGAGGVRTAALIMPSIAPTAEARPLAPAVASVVAPVVRVATASAVTTRVSAPRVRATIIQVAAVSAPVSVGARPVVIVRKAPVQAPAQAVAMLDRSLLSATTMGDLLAAAKSERRQR